MEEKKVKSGKKAKKDDKIGEALLKVALGYQIAEVTEEYAEVDGALKLTKRKKTKKDVPPDLKAVQLLLSSGESADYGQWSDEALEAEKQRLLLELQAKMAESGEASVAAKKSVVKKGNKAAAELCVEESALVESGAVDEVGIVEETASVADGGAADGSVGGAGVAERSVSEAPIKEKAKRAVKKGAAAKKKVVKKAAK